MIWRCSIDIKGYVFPCIPNPHPMLGASDTLTTVTGILAVGGCLPFGQMRSKGRSSENTPSEAIRSNMFEKIFLNCKLCHAVHYNSVANRANIYNLCNSMILSLDASDTLTAVQILTWGGVVVAIWSNMFESLFKPQQVGRNRYCAAVKYVKLQHNCGASLAGSLSSILE